ncbi:MAG: type II toxin-antitoxin system VapC family toxin [Anaerolineae bacterium]|nr:type II toxin-antitoxin system VapC family toxin [Anaerolineae bacterium]
MELSRFAADTEIFIDANIFTYFALQNPIYQAACTAFLSRVETGEVRAIASVFSLNEAFYTMLIGKGSELLNSTKIKQIKAKLAADPTFATACYQACLDFSRYVTILRATGLRLVEVDYDLQVKALPLGHKYCLLPTDALHVATCQHYGILHIATTDSHFEQVELLTVWKPAPV